MQKKEWRMWQDPAVTEARQLEYRVNCLSPEFSQSLGHRCFQISLQSPGHRACHFPSGSVVPQLLHRNRKIALGSYRASGSGQRPAPWLRIRTVLQVLALRSLRPRSQSLLRPVQGQARRLHFVSVSRRTPPSRTAPPAPARNREKSRQAWRPGQPPALPRSHSGRPLPRASGHFLTPMLEKLCWKRKEKPKSPSWCLIGSWCFNRLRDQWSLLLFKTNFQDPAGHMDATESQCIVGDIE